MQTDTPLFRIVLPATLLIGLWANAAQARSAPPSEWSAAQASVSPAAGPRLYQRPIHSAAFGPCEWVRVRSPNGVRWRALCP